MKLNQPPTRPNVTAKLAELDAKIAAIPTTSQPEPQLTTDQVIAFLAAQGFDAQFAPQTWRFGELDSITALVALAAPLRAVTIKQKVLLSNPASLFSSPKCPSLIIHWDNACSYNLTNNKSLFSSLHPHPNPIPIGCVGGSCIATHAAGYLNCLPSLNYINLALCCPTAHQTLLSFGHLHQCGGGFSTSPKSFTLSIFADSSTLLDTTTLQPNCNLYPTTLPQQYQTLRSNPHLNCIPTHKPTLSPFSRHFVHHHPPTSIPSPPLFGFLAHSVHITAKQKARVLEVIDHHIARAHPPDHKLCRDLFLGKIPYSTLIPTDIHLMCKVCGPCPQCPEGRGNKASAIRLPSQTPPPATTSPGESNSFDPQKLPCTVLGGFTQKATLVDK